MEVIKKLGNNAAICKDNSGRELIAIGLGIGFNILILKFLVLQQM